MEEKTLEAQLPPSGAITKRVALWRTPRIRGRPQHLFLAGKGWACRHAAADGANGWHDPRRPTNRSRCHTCQAAVHVCEKHEPPVKYVGDDCPTCLAETAPRG